MPQTKPGAANSEWLQQLQRLAGAYKKQKAAEKTAATRREEVQKVVEKERRTADRWASSFAATVETGTANAAAKLKEEAKGVATPRRAQLEDALPKKYGDVSARAIE